jgi:[ribosomal protein S5]-alanine N-acetyltransferase
VIETARLRLVPWPRSALDLAGLERELGVAVPSGWRPDVTDILPAAPPPYGPYAVLAGDELVGDAGFHGPPDESGTVEIGYEVAPGQRRKGYATETVAALVSWALKQEGVRRIVAAPLPDNTASRRVLEHAGFERVGRRGDELLYELRAV